MASTPYPAVARGETSAAATSGAITARLEMDVARFRETSARAMASNRIPGVTERSRRTVELPMITPSMGNDPPP